jgi:hypothetical protein
VSSAGRGSCRAAADCACGRAPVAHQRGAGARSLSAIAAACARLRPTLNCEARIHPVDPGSLEGLPRFVRLQGALGVAPRRRRPGGAIVSSATLADKPRQARATSGCSAAADIGVGEGEGVGRDQQPRGNSVGIVLAEHHRRRRARRSRRRGEPAGRVRCSAPGSSCRSGRAGHASGGCRKARKSSPVPAPSRRCRCRARCRTARRRPRPPSRTTNRPARDPAHAGCAACRRTGSRRGCRATPRR